MLSIFRLVQGLTSCKTALSMINKKFPSFFLPYQN